MTTLNINTVRGNIVKYTALTKAVVMLNLTVVKIIYCWSKRVLDIGSRVAVE